MNNLINGVKGCIQTGNFYGALYLALSLPDVCCSLESANGKSNRDKYAAWFDKYLSDKYTVMIGYPAMAHTFLSGHDCYALRCAALHEGSGELSGTAQEVRDVLDRICISVGMGHLVQLERWLQIDCVILCADICQAVEFWLESFDDRYERLKNLLVIHTEGFVIKLT